MASNTIPLTYGRYYHIYNHGVGGRDLFKDKDNYFYFLKLYEKHLGPIVDTYAWVLMKNHFHFLVRIKDEEEIIKYLNPHPTGFQNLDRSGVGVTKPKPPHQYFSNFFNAYTKAFNKYYQTWGTLFERPFRRKLIDNEDYLKRVVLYIHNNPVHHGFCEHPVEYPWSSYLTERIIKTKREEVISWFDDLENYKAAHLIYKNLDLENEGIN
jgi:putative transposase